MKALLALGLLVAACGPDADAPVDARPDSAAPLPDASDNCTYTERDDAGNDTTEGGGAEATAINLAGAAPLVLCGSFSSSHFDGDITVDVDAYLVNAATDVDVIVRLIGNAGAIEYAGVDFYGGPTYETLFGTGTFYGDHAVAAVHLPAGTYELTPFALSSEAIASDITYTVEVVSDTPATRCPEVTAGGYAEATDGAASTGNDVFAVPSGAPVALTASATDAAEPTAITLAPLAATRFTGSAADVAVADQYEDRDAYAFQTGAATNEISLRLTWAVTADLDFLLFEGANIVPELRAITAATVGPELRTYAVKPSTKYTLLVAARPGGSFPVAYTASVCGAAYP